MDKTVNVNQMPVAGISIFTACINDFVIAKNYVKYINKQINDYAKIMHSQLKLNLLIKIFLKKVIFMKKMFLTMITLFIIGICSANAQAVWGARVGVSKPTLTFGGDWKGDKISGKFGLEAGPVLYYSLSDNFYINPSVMFSIKTFDLGNVDISMYYADIPVYAGYNFSLGKLSLYAQAGPFAGFKLAESVKGADEKSGLGAFNAGIGAIVGVSVKKFKVELGYQQGLTNVLKEKAEGISLKMSSLFIGINYVF
jgi:hypothetical protein